jgi:putative uncharacterized protein (fragment)
MFIHEAAKKWPGAIISDLCLEFIFIIFYTIPMDIFERCALKTPDILLPNKTVDLTAWSVIACDQYTQDTDYWSKVAAVAKDRYSTLHMILPEVYLNTISDEQRKQEIVKIQKTMKDYLATGVFAEPIHSMLYIERKTAYNRLRKGIITCIDLEKYDWRPDSKAEIRATEATIIERLPPRMEIRQGAVLEMPHIMLLVDDPERMLIEQIGASIYSSQVMPLYTTQLMLNSGSISGWSIPADCSAYMEKALEKLYSANTDADGSVFMFAVGDGNHSLATAKAVWDAYKREHGGMQQANSSISLPADLGNNPLRYALVEIVNLYDSGLTFEPIHRVIFGADTKQLISFLQAKLGGKVIACSDKAALLQKVEHSSASFGFIAATGDLTCLETDVTCLAVSALQPLLDDFIKTHNLQIDYIHGSDEAFRIPQYDDAVSILLPPISKESFFSTIAESGSLPRKSFSMGEASEKRFYLECRKLI